MHSEHAFADERTFAMLALRLYMRLDLTAGDMKLLSIFSNKLLESCCEPWQRRTVYGERICTMHMHINRYSVQWKVTVEFKNLEIGKCMNESEMVNKFLKRKFLKHYYLLFYLCKNFSIPTLMFHENKKLLFI